LAQPTFAIARTASFGFNQWRSIGVHRADLQSVQLGRRGCGSVTVRAMARERLRLRLFALLQCGLTSAAVPV
jgi:hypothetical protein